jgi:putative flippase GtrA
LAGVAQIGEAGRFIRFVMVGGAGFLVDAGVLAALHHRAALDPFSARLVSIAAAALVTWRLNRAFTFESAGARQGREGLRYALVALVAAGLNFLLYALVLSVIPGLPPVAAVVVATFISLLVSYLGYSRFAFGVEGPAVSVSPRSQSR